MVFFYRRFLPLDVYKYAFGAENDASSSNLPIPLVKPKEAVSNFAFETASLRYLRLFCLAISYANIVVADAAEREARNSLA